MNDITQNPLFTYQDTFFVKKFTKEIDIRNLQEIFTCSYLNDRWHPNSITATDRLLMGQHEYHKESLIGHIVQLTDVVEGTIENLVKSLKKYSTVFVHPLQALSILFSDHYNVLLDTGYHELPRIISIPNTEEFDLDSVWYNKYKDELYIPLVTEYEKGPELHFMRHPPKNLELRLEDFLVFFTKNLDIKAE